VQGLEMGQAFTAAAVEGDADTRAAARNSSSCCLCSRLGRSSRRSRTAARQGGRGAAPAERAAGGSWRAADRSGLGMGAARAVVRRRWPAAGTRQQGQPGRGRRSCLRGVAWLAQPAVPPARRAAEWRGRARGQRGTAAPAAAEGAAGGRGHGSDGRGAAASAAVLQQRGVRRRARGAAGGCWVQQQRRGDQPAVRQAAGARHCRPR
jgi:hypothetical protein